MKSVTLSGHLVIFVKIRIRICTYSTTIQLILLPVPFPRYEAFCACRLEIKFERRCFSIPRISVSLNDVVVQTNGRISDSTRRRCVYECLSA